MIYFINKLYLKESIYKYYGIMSIQITINLTEGWGKDIDNLKPILILD